MTFISQTTKVWEMKNAMTVEKHYEYRLKITNSSKPLKPLSHIKDDQKSNVSHIVLPCEVLSVTSSGLTNWVTEVYRVDLSNGQPFLRQVACTRAVRYDSGMCKPDSHITGGSLSFTCPTDLWN